MINLILINKLVHYSKEKKYFLGNLSFPYEDLWAMVFLELNYYEIYVKYIVKQWDNNIFKNNLFRIKH